jgi:hypothetical protein
MGSRREIGISGIYPIIVSQEGRDVKSKSLILGNKMDFWVEFYSTSLAFFTVTFTGKVLCFLMDPVNNSQNAQIT